MRKGIRKQRKKMVSCLCIFMTVILFTGFGAEYAGNLQGEQVYAASEVALNRKSLSMMVGSAYRLKVNKKPAKATVTWESDNKKVATVSKNGKVRAKAIGTTKITAKVKGKKLTCSVKVKQITTASNAAKIKFIEFLTQSGGANSALKKWCRYSDVDVSDLKFACLDMGKAKVPTLFLYTNKTDHAEGNYALFQYVNGKVKFLSGLDGFPEVYPEAGIVSMYHTGGGYGEICTWYYRINSKKKLGTCIAETRILPKDLSKEEYKFGRKMFGKDQYKINGKKVSKSTFTKKYKSWTKNSSFYEESYKVNIDKYLVKNTEKNRDIYLKIKTSANVSIDNVVKFYKEKKYIQAIQMAKQLPKTITEDCVKNMSADRKAAYLKEINKYPDFPDEDEWDDEFDYEEDYFLGCYLTDFDNDGEAEMIVKYGDGSRMGTGVKLYKYQNGEMKTWSMMKRNEGDGLGFSGFYAYPGHEGVLVLTTAANCNWIDLCTLQGSKCKWTNIVDMADDGEGVYYKLQLPYQLDLYGKDSSVFE